MAQLYDMTLTPRTPVVEGLVLPVPCGRLESPEVLLREALIQTHGFACDLRDMPSCF